MQKRRKPIAFYPELAIELGDVESAIYYQQLYYWSDKGSRSDGFIYKTKEDIEFETTLTRRQQDRIREKLEKNGWLETKLIKVGTAPTLHYRTKFELNLIVTKGTNRLVPNVLIQDKYERDYSSISESTTESTPMPQAAEKDLKYEEEDGEGYLIHRKQKRVPRSPITPRQTLKFDYGVALQGLFDSSIRADRIIANLFKFKGIVFDNPVSMQSQVKRHSKAAKSLEGYNGQQLKRAFDFCEKESEHGQKYRWGLETVLKVIDEINK